MAEISLLGVPHDDNSSFLKGPAEAPPAIRRELHSDAYSIWSETGVDLSDRFIDCGDVDFASAADPWDAITEAAGRAMDQGQPLIVLGGDHAITHPVMRAVRRRHARLTILHFDAHPDIYDAYQGNPRSHASPFARIMEERLTDRLIQVGLRALNEHHRAQFKRFGVETIEMGRCNGPLDLKLTTPVYISLDLDGLDPAHAPGVSHREPGGLMPRQVIDWIHGIEQPIIGADIVEYNPRCDVAGMTATVAAKLVKEIAGMMVRTRA
ncbi:MAG TPA: agmatinase family protein [Candidatus Cybelea sp.]|nr:agmatinase family protein [Candidatus Cybelea sp.]